VTGVRYQWTVGIDERTELRPRTGVTAEQPFKLYFHNTSQHINHFTGSMFGASPSVQALVQEWFVISDGSDIIICIAVSALRRSRRRRRSPITYLPLAAPPLAITIAARHRHRRSAIRHRHRHHPSSPLMSSSPMFMFIAIAIAQKLAHVASPIFRPAATDRHSHHPSPSYHPSPSPLAAP
jgi:hypothetical protein